MTYLIPNFLPWGGSCALIMKALLEYHREKNVFQAPKLLAKPLFLPSRVYTKHKMNKSSIHFAPFCHCSCIWVAYQAVQRRGKNYGPHKHVIHLLHYSCPWIPTQNELSPQSMILWYFVPLFWFHLKHFNITYLHT